MADNDRLSFSLKILDETKPTSDNRYFVPGTVSWRPVPLSLMAIRSNDPNGGHKNSTAIGSITDIWRQDGSIYGRGEFANDEVANEFIPLIEQGVLAGVSADVVGAKREVELADDNETQQERINGGQIAAVTVLPIPAYEDTRIVVAAAGPVNPPAEWFAAPAADTAPYALTVEADGRVHGFAATWGSCHIGRPDTCLQPPKSKSDYASFQIGEVVTAEGERIPTGTITMATNHAGISLNARQAIEHYDHTGAAVADVAVHELDNGIYFSGSLRPDITVERIREFSGSGVSGDWRRINGALDLVGILAVNTPGFPVPRAKYGVEADNTQTSLVAAGFVSEEVVAEFADCGCDEADELPTNETEVVFTDAKPSPLTDDEESGEPDEEKTDEEDETESFAAKVAAVKAIMDVRTSEFYNRNHGADGRFTTKSGAKTTSGRVGAKGSKGSHIEYPKRAAAAAPKAGLRKDRAANAAPSSKKFRYNWTDADAERITANIKAGRKSGIVGQGFKPSEYRSVQQSAGEKSSLLTVERFKTAKGKAKAIVEAKYRKDKAKKDAARAAQMRRVAEQSRPPRKNDRVKDTGDNNKVKNPKTKTGR